MSPAGPESEPDNWREPCARATAHRQRPRVYPEKRRLDHIVHHLALALGGRSAASFARRLMLPVSNDTPTPRAQTRTPDFEAWNASIGLCRRVANASWRKRGGGLSGRRAALPRGVDHARTSRMGCGAASTRRRRHPKRHGRQTSVGSVHRGGVGDQRQRAGSQTRKGRARPRRRPSTQTVGNVARRGNVPGGDRFGSQAGYDRGGEA